MTSDSELYNDIVEMLSNGNFLQLNGKAINLTELNEYINAQQEEIERLNNIINRTTKYVESYVESLSSSGRGCDIYEDIKQEILKELKGSVKE